MANTTYIHAIGRRKTASAQARLFDGAGENTVNGKPISEYVTRGDLFDIAFKPLKIVDVKDKMHFDVKIAGGWVSAQVQAIAHALSRALSTKDDAFKRLLKEAGLLTRDARKVERKKPGKKKARKSPSWSKR